MTLFLLLLGGLASAASLELLLKKVLYDVDTKTMLLYRGLFMIGMSIFAISFFPLEVTAMHLGMMLLVGILAALAYFLRSNALKNLEISYVAPTFGLSPLFVTLFAYLIMKELPSLIQIAGIVLVSTSIYILELKPKMHFIEPFKKFLKNSYARQSLYSCMLFGITVSLDRLILNSGVHPLTYLFYVWFFINLYHIADAIFSKQAKKLKGKHAFPIFLAALLIVVLHLFFYNALAIAHAGVVSAIYALQIFIIAIAGGNFFHDHHRKKRSLAALLVTIGGLLIALG
ncbi:DMT family transporter [Candidatus Nomurabacteria bacterium]|nr:DMT family transporter [Candidatus Nomurabacteria bacterium]